MKSFAFLQQFAWNSTEHSGGVLRSGLEPPARSDSSPDRSTSLGSKAFFGVPSDLMQVALESPGRGARSNKQTQISSIISGGGGWRSKGLFHQVFLGLLRCQALHVFLSTYISSFLQSKLWQNHVFLSCQCGGFHLHHVLILLRPRSNPQFAVCCFHSIS